MLGIALSLKQEFPREACTNQSVVALEMAKAVLDPHVRSDEIVQSCYQLLDVSADKEPEIPHVPLVECTDEAV